MKTFVVEYEGVVLPALAIVGARDEREAKAITRRQKAPDNPEMPFWVNIVKEGPEWLQTDGAPGFFEIWDGDY